MSGVDQRALRAAADAYAATRSEYEAAAAWRVKEAEARYRRAGGYVRESDE
jgi:hypothetical protein